MTTKVLVGRILFGLAFAAAGLWMARLSVFAFGRRKRWKEEGIVAEGRIVGFEERSDTDASDRRKLFAPIVEFRTVEGAPIRFTSSTANRPNPYTEGQTIAVRYMRLSPQDADLDRETGSLLIPLATAFMAIVFLGVALLPILLPPPAPR